MWVQREPAAFVGVPGGLVVVLNGPSSSGKSTLATAIQQAADTPWIRLLPDEFFQWHMPERYGAFGGAAGPWQEGFFAMLAGLARADNQVVTCAAGLDSQAGVASAAGRGRLPVHRAGPGPGGLRAAGMRPR